MYTFSLIHTLIPAIIVFIFHKIKSFFYPINNFLIVLSGPNGSGKDLSSDYLHTKKGFLKLTFAKILKDIVSKLYNIPRDHFDDREKKELLREKLFLVSEILYSSLDKRVFTEHIENIIKMNKDKNIVISDCRYDHEIEMLNKYSSVYNLLYIDVSVINSSTVESLYKKLDTIIT